MCRKDTFCAVGQRGLSKGLLGVTQGQMLAAASGLQLPANVDLEDDFPFFVA